MKWKCDYGCQDGPCLYEGNAVPSCCINWREYSAGWKKVEEEPERKEESGLPEWLKVGNFVVFENERSVYIIEGYDVNQHTISIAYKNIFGKLDHSDVHCGDGWGKARVVFPKPYTFETAPVMLKIRRKLDLKNRIVKLHCFDGQTWGYLNEYSAFSFENILNDYEQLDGWPCGTFDEE